MNATADAPTKAKKTGKQDKVKLPKHYGKTQIEADIKKQGKPATEKQKAMLALNEMRNMYSKLKNRGISDMVAGTDKLSDEDARTIVAVVNTMKKKLNPILKNK